MLQRPISRDAAPCMGPRLMPSLVFCIVIMNERPPSQGQVCVEGATEWTTAGGDCSGAAGLLLATLEVPLKVSFLLTGMQCTCSAHNSLCRLHATFDARWVCVGLCCCWLLQG